jgi:predicted ABC-type sugar transport system permease subunit
MAFKPSKIASKFVESRPTGKSLPNIDRRQSIRCNALDGVVDYGRLAAAVAEIGQELDLIESPDMPVGRLPPRTSILGGQGTYLGTIAGAMLLVTMTALITVVNGSEGWRSIFSAA